MKEKDIIKGILEVLCEKEADISTIKHKLKITEPVLPYLLWLEEMNFVKRINLTERYKFLASKWKITRSGRAYLDFITSSTRRYSPELPKISLVYVCPKQFERKIMMKNGVHLVGVLEDLFTTANDEILISSPYIDPILIPFIRKVKESVKILILTHRKDNFLIRLENENKNLKIKALREFREGVQIYQLHAKYICVDNKFCLITSANLNERSVFHNFEIGVMIEDQTIANTLREFFLKLFEVC